MTDSGEYGFYKELFSQTGLTYKKAISEIKKFWDNLHENWKKHGLEYSTLEERDFPIRMETVFTLARFKHFEWAWRYLMETEKKYLAEEFDSIKASLYYQEKKYGNALEHYEKLLEKRPGDKNIILSIEDMKKRIKETK